MVAWVASQDVLWVAARVPGWVADWVAAKGRVVLILWVTLWVSR